MQIRLSVIRCHRHGLTMLKGPATMDSISLTITHHYARTNYQLLQHLYKLYDITDIT